MNKADFTPTQWRFIETMMDGRPRSREELCRLLDDPDDTKSGSVRVHIHFIRKGVRRYGYDVTTQKVRATCYYRMVRTLARPDA